ncbi:MAG: hypothetical protein OHK0046_49290 [Anaerolineae bacterium]
MARYSSSNPSLARQHSIEVLAYVAILSSVSGVIAQFITLLFGTSIEPAALLVTSLYSLLCFLVLGLVRQGKIESAAELLVILFLVALLAIPVVAVRLLFGLVTVVSSAFLRRRLVYLLVNFIVVAVFFAEFLNVTLANAYQFSDEGFLLVIQISVLIITSAIVRAFVTISDSAARSAHRTADLLTASAEIGQITASLVENQHVLFERAVDLIRERLGFYHVQIFMIDERREFAVLRASTGKVGQQLIAREHKLAVGSQSVIGRVTQMGEPLVARDTDMDTIHARNELLPNTRSELALPIVDGENIIGALDVQSTQIDAFDPTAIQALQIMSNQLGIAIRNSQLFRQQKEGIDQAKQLFLEARANSREVERLTRQLTRKAWDQYMVTNPNMLKGITISTEGIRMNDNTWTSEMISAAHKRASQQMNADGRYQLTVPILLAGEVIGVIDIESETRVTESETVELIEAVAQRLAVSLDNARLFDEVQKSARQEQRINEIATQYAEALRVDDLLQITLRELSASLGARQGMIRLGTPFEGMPTTSSAPQSSSGLLNGGTPPDGNGHVNGSTSS